MKTSRFEKLEELLRTAECVEDVFGEKPPDNKEIEKLFEDMKKFNRSASNANLDYRSEALIRDHIPFFCRWAKRQKMLKRWGERDKYPLAIKIQITDHEGFKKFYLPTQKFEIYFSELHSLNFVGYWHNDKVIVRNDKEIIREGKVTYYGTHGATEFWKNVAPKEEYMCTLTPEMFELGNTIEIQTWAYFGVGEFLAKAWR